LFALLTYFQIDDYSLVRFLPLDVSDEESIGDVLLQIDMALQYGEDLEPREPQVSGATLTLLVGRQEGHPTCKKPWGDCGVSAVSPVGVAPSHCRCLCLHYLPLLHKNPEDGMWGNPA